MGDDIQEIPMPVVKTEPQPVQPTTANSSVVDTMGMEVANMEEGYVEGYDDYGGHQYGGSESVSQQQGFSNYVQKTETGFNCEVCGKQFNDQSNCRRHIKEKHFGD